MLVGSSKPKQASRLEPRRTQRYGCTTMSSQVNVAKPCKTNCTASVRLPQPVLLQKSFVQHFRSLYTPVHHSTAKGSHRTLCRKQPMAWRPFREPPIGSPSPTSCNVALLCRSWPGTSIAECNRRASSGFRQDHHPTRSGQHHSHKEP